VSPFPNRACTFQRTRLSILVMSQRLTLYTLSIRMT